MQNVHFLPRCKRYFCQSWQNGIRRSYSRDIKMRMFVRSVV